MSWALPPKRNHNGGTSWFSTPLMVLTKLETSGCVYADAVFLPASYVFESIAAASNMNFGCRVAGKYLSVRQRKQLTLAAAVVAVNCRV